MYRATEEVRSTHGRDGGVALDVQRGRMFNLNPVGSRVLELVKRGTAESEIVASICLEFAAPREQVEPDVCEFLLELTKLSLIEADDEPV